MGICLVEEHNESRRERTRERENKILNKQDTIGMNMRKEIDRTRRMEDNTVKTRNDAR